MTKDNKKRIEAGEAGNEKQDHDKEIRKSRGGREKRKRGRGMREGAAELGEKRVWNAGKNEIKQEIGV